MSSETLRYAIWDNVTDVSKVSRSFEASATLHQLTWRNISETLAIPLKEPQIYQNRVGFDDSNWNKEHETPVIKCLGDPPNQAVIENCRTNTANSQLQFCLLSYFICVVQDTDSVRIRSC